MAHEIVEFFGAADESGIIIKIKLRSISDFFSFRTKNFELYDFGARDFYYILILFAVYNFFLLFLTEIFSIQYCFGFFSFLFSMTRGGFCLLWLLYNRDLMEWHGAEHKLIASLKNCKNIGVSEFKNSSRVSAYCGSRSVLWGVILFIYCAMIIGLDGMIQYFMGSAYSWIIFVALFFIFLSPYKKLCDHWLWRPVQKYLLTAEPCKEKTEEALELGLRIKRFMEGGILNKWNIKIG
mgnify:CR=1 FL=1